MVFNNGFNRTNQISTVETIQPTFNQDGSYQLSANGNFLPDQSDWVYQMPVFVDFVSGASRLPNGNTFITSGPDGHLYELDHQDQPVWEYVSPADPNNTYVTQGNLPLGNTMFKAIKYSENHPAFINRTITPSGPIELNPIASNCVIYSKTIVGIDGNNLSSLEVQVIQNPITDQLRIANKTNKVVQIQIVDLMGREIINLNTSDQLISIPSGDWNSQMYIVTVRQNNQVHQQKVIKR
jgi:hypothetical protein